MQLKNISSETTIVLESLERERFYVDPGALHRFPLLRKYRDDNQHGMVSSSDTFCQIDGNRVPKLVAPVVIREEILKIIIEWIQHLKQVRDEEVRSEINANWEKCFVDKLEMHLLTEILWGVSLLGVPSLSVAVSNRISTICSGSPAPQQVHRLFNLTGD